MYAGRGIYREPPSLEHPMFYIFGNVTGDGMTNANPIWGHPNAAMMPSIRPHLPWNTLPEFAAPPTVPETGWGPVPKASDPLSQAYMDRLQLAALNAAGLIAQHQYANGWWQGFGTEDYESAGDRKVGGAASVEFGTWRGYTSATNCYPTICPLWAHPADTLTNVAPRPNDPNSGPDDLTGVTKRQTWQPPNDGHPNSPYVERAVGDFNWWTKEGRALAAVYADMLAQAVKRACDRFSTPTGGDQPVCYPKYWHFDSEQRPDIRCFWNPLGPGGTQIGMLQNALRESDRFASEPVGVRTGAAATMSDFWLARPGAFALPTGHIWSDPEAWPLDKWCNSVSVESMTWALARSFRDTFVQTFPAMQVSDYDSVVCKSDTSYFPLSAYGEPSLYVARARNLDINAPVLYADPYVAPATSLSAQMTYWRSKLRACDSSMPIVPWIAHPDTGAGFGAGPRSWLMELVRVCAGEFGISQFALYGAAQTNNWDAPNLASLIDEAARSVQGTSVRVSFAVIRRLARRHRVAATFRG